MTKILFMRYGIIANMMAESMIIKVIQCFRMLI